MDRQQKIDKIKEVIGQDRNVGNEYEGDFWIREVMIGDVLDWMTTNTPDNEERNMIFNHYRELRSPMDEQNEECIDYVYSLLESDNSLCKNEDK